MGKMKPPVRLMLNQVGDQVGIRKFRQHAVDALFQEFTQLDEMEVFRGATTSTVTYEQKKGALRAINLTKEKVTEP